MTSANQQKILFKYYAATVPLKTSFPYFVDCKVYIKNIGLQTGDQYVYINPDKPIIKGCIIEDCTPVKNSNPKLSDTPVSYTIKSIDNSCNIQLQSDPPGSSDKKINIRIYTGEQIDGCNNSFLTLGGLDDTYISAFYITQIRLDDESSYSIPYNCCVFEFPNLTDAINKWYYTKDSSVYVNKCCMPFVRGIDTNFYNTYCPSLTYDNTKVASEECMKFYTEYCKSEDGQKDITCACDDSFQDDPNNKQVIARNYIQSKGLSIPRICIIDQCEAPQAFKFDFNEGTCPAICLNAINVLNNTDSIIDLHNVNMKLTCSGPNGGIDLTDNPDNPNNLGKKSYKLWLIILFIVIIIIVVIICICKYFKFF